LKISSRLSLSWKWILKQVIGLRDKCFFNLDIKGNLDDIIIRVTTCMHINEENPSHEPALVHNLHVVMSNNKTRKNLLLSCWLKWAWPVRWLLCWTWTFWWITRQVGFSQLFPARYHLMSEVDWIKKSQSDSKFLMASANVSRHMTYVKHTNLFPRGGGALLILVHSWLV
jgi:hypothetical protein